jgi:DNA-binding CsgD family transcriptional regulator
LKPLVFTNSSISQLESEEPHARCGLVVLDSLARPVWANAEAVQILMFPSAGPAKRHTTLRQKIRALLVQEKHASGASVKSIASRVRSGMRTYVCRVLTLDTCEAAGGDSLIAILLERNNSSSACLSKAATELGLTPRERQALSLLGQGLTSRQIAASMGISPNTVKAFLRVIMIKMGVSSRSSILGRVFGGRDWRSTRSLRAS